MGRPLPGYFFGTVRTDNHTFTVTGLGPGRYHIQVEGCEHVDVAEFVGRTQKTPLSFVLRHR